VAVELGLAAAVAQRGNAKGTGPIASIPLDSEDDDLGDDGGMALAMLGNPYGVQRSSERRGLGG
jgi:hypothetical protein